MFTRGPAGPWKSTAIFNGGSDVAAGEALFEQVQKTFFGPVRVSVMMDSNGSNTTAAAAVLAAGKHLDLSTSTALILGGTGPVGQRAGQILARLGAKVPCTRSIDRAAEQARGKGKGRRRRRVASRNWFDAVSPQRSTASIGHRPAEPRACSFPDGATQTDCTLKVAIDLNAVPPAGIEGIGVMDKAVEQDGVFCYGAIGVGGTKMKIHRAAVQKLFTANDLRARHRRHLRNRVEPVSDSSAETGGCDNSTDGQNDGPWYRDGLSSRCTGCGNCCTGGPGFSSVDDAEIVAIAEYLDKPVGEIRLMPPGPQPRLVE